MKPVLSGLFKIDKTKVLKTNGSLMKVKSNEECSTPLENQVLVFFLGSHLRQVLLYICFILLTVVLDLIFII